MTTASPPTWAARRPTRNLRDRAWARGIRLASDMVPNHMGIDSRWVIEHPDWFISRPDPPYPAYTFNGPNLSSDERVGIYIEDHYFDNTTRRWSFKRVDRWTARSATSTTATTARACRGTTPPSSTTSRPEVREAVIQTILHVARQFPVIRFDAAMTLAKKHIQRLWYPEPGSGGAIPSRAEYGDDPGASSTAACRSSSGARWSTAWPRRRPTRCCWPRPSG
jgi:glycosidase